MQFLTREIYKESDEELALVARRCMNALETIPEFEGNEKKAREANAMDSVLAVT
jgi:hypothetical protein